MRKNYVSSFKFKNVDGNCIDKPKLLIELFNNAKKSKWREAIIGNEMYPDKFVRDMMSDFYQPRIQEKLSKLHLTDEKQSILEAKNFIDY